MVTGLMRARIVGPDNWLVEAAGREAADRGKE